MTINEALVMSKVLRERMNELAMLRNAGTHERRVIMDGKMQEINQPRYDMRELDKQIVKIRNFLLKTETKIKQANANTQIAMEESEGEALLQSLE